MNKFIIFLSLIAFTNAAINQITKTNEDLFKYSPSDVYTLTEDVDEDKPPTLYSGANTAAKTELLENYNSGKQFKLQLKTQNGIDIQQVGKLKDSKTFVVSGQYSFTGADGKRYKTRYTADELGYHPMTELDTDLPDQAPIPVSVKEISFKFLNQDLQNKDIFIHSKPFGTLEQNLQAPFTDGPGSGGVGGAGAGLGGIGGSSGPQLASKFTGLSGTGNGFGGASGASAGFGGGSSGNTGFGGAYGASTGLGGAKGTSAGLGGSKGAGAGVGGLSAGVGGSSGTQLASRFGGDDDESAFGQNGFVAGNHKQGSGYAPKGNKQGLNGQKGAGFGGSSNTQNSFSQSGSSIVGGSNLESPYSQSSGGSGRQDAQSEGDHSKDGYNYAPPSSKYLPSSFDEPANLRH